MIEAVYTCGMCGIKIVEKQDKDQKTLEKKELWHECADGYIVPLQSIVEKSIDEPVKKKNHK